MAKSRKRSLAAKRGWETRRKNEEKRQALAQRYKRSLASRKGWATRRIKEAEKPVRGKTERERDLERKVRQLQAKVAQQDLELVRAKEQIRKRNERINVLRHKIKRIKKPHVVELQEAIKADKAAADRAVADGIKERVADGWDYYAAMYDVWEEYRDFDEYEDIADIREVWEDESPTVE